jgi:hypothetical protein
MRFCGPPPPRDADPRRPLPPPRPGCRLSGLIPGRPRGVAPRPPALSPVALTAFPASRSPAAGACFGAASPESAPLPWPSRARQRAALPGSPRGAHRSPRQDALDGTGGGCAPPAQRATPLRHPGSPPCTGSLRRGSLALTATGLAPVSCQCLSGHTNGWLGELEYIEDIAVAPVRTFKDLDLLDGLDRKISDR